LPGTAAIGAKYRVFDGHGRSAAGKIKFHGQLSAVADTGRLRTVFVVGRQVAQQGAQITTVEGLADGDRLHPLQAAFIERDAFQCGYCTPGQILSCVGFLHEGGGATDAEIREGMSGNICRCGAYPNIVAAVRGLRGRT